MSRSDILARIQQAMSPQVQGQLNHQTPLPGHSEMPSDLLPKVFAAAWETLGGTWELHENATAARLAFLLYLREQNIRFIIAWSIRNLPIEGLAEMLQDVDIQLVSTNRRDIDPDIVVGLTSASAALAATGSLVLVPESGQSWLPALLPIRHIILLPTSCLYSDLNGWRHAWVNDDKNNDLARALIITGPSSSSDIELHSHKGMFGPRSMHVVVFQDD
jgi:L-lactate dehydrogenase complex protein LldG